MMTQGEIVLSVIVVILIIYVISRSRAGASKQGHCRMPMDKDADVTTVVLTHRRGCHCPKCSDPEKNAIKEHSEYFTVCGDSTDIQKELSCYCSDSTGQFAENSYGGPGLSYNDWVLSQGVDQQVLVNHAQFVQDRSQGGSVNWTGRTYAMPDEIESEFYPNSWQGIRGRPQAVPVCNPTQVTDPASTQFTTQQKLVINTSSS